MTVITLERVPASLRGDLTKWMQEIATGVYVGNFNSRVREHLWKRVKEGVGKGEATLSYRHQNELGYRFETWNAKRRPVDFDGIELVLFPSNKKGEEETGLRRGFSNAAKFRMAKKFAAIKAIKEKEKSASKEYAVLVLKTDSSNRLSELAVTRFDGKNREYLWFLIGGETASSESESFAVDNADSVVPVRAEIAEVLAKFAAFVGDLLLICYESAEKLAILDAELNILGKPQLANKKIDLLRFVKKDNMFLSDYRLATVIEDYFPEAEIFKNALEESNILCDLAMKLNGFLAFLAKGS